MADIGETATIEKVRLQEQAGDPAVPAAGFWVVYMKATGLFLEDPAGNIYGPLAESGTPGVHATSHENGGGDEISVAGLSGVLADGQTPVDHNHVGIAGDGGKLSAAIIDSYLDWEEIAAPANPGANVARMYSKDDTGTTKLYYRRSDGTEIEVGGSGGSSVDTIGITIDGGGSAITTGVKGYIQVPYGCTIDRVTLLADQSGSIVIDIWKDTYANYPPTDADTITAAAPPTITTAVKSQDSTLTGWTTAITADDILGFNVDSCSTIQRVHLLLKVTRS